MKKVLLLVLAAIAAFVCAEGIVAKIIGYPTYGLGRKMLGIRGLDRPVNIFKPYARYWTVEGGNRVFRLNNIGLPGDDVKTAADSKYVFVLGSSYVEAYQWPPSKIASSLFQNKLQIQDATYQVLNLGINGQDPYDLYWRAIYYEKTYPPAMVFLVLDRTLDERFERHPHPLNFDPRAKVPRPLDSAIMNGAILLWNHSAFLNLVSNLVINRTSEGRAGQAQGSFPLKSPALLGSDLRTCISKFKEKFFDRFVLIAMSEGKESDASLRDFCRVEGIRFMSRDILEPRYRLSGRGHLNGEGNQILAETLYEAFIQ